MTKNPKGFPLSVGDDITEGRKRYSRAKLVVLLPVILALLSPLIFSDCDLSVRRPNVLIITVDALRGDHLELRGYSRETAPELAALARRGAYFENAVVQAPLTIPSLLMTMTGKLFYHDRIPDDMPTLAEILRSKGYATAAFVRNPLIELDHRGLERGFDTFFCPEKVVGSPVTEENLQDVADAQLYKQDLKAGELIGHAQQWLDQNRDTQPFFLWIHLFDPHDPYSPPEPYNENFDPDYEGRVDGDVRATSESGNPIWGEVENNPPPEDHEHIIALYDGEVRYTSARIGAFLEDFEAAGYGKRTLIVVSSDHGESLGEHKLWGHGLSVYEPETLIPLIMVFPRKIPEGVVSSQPVESIDIVPTILSLLGEEAGERFGGKNLTPLMRKKAPADAKAGGFARWEGQLSFRSRRWKLVDNDGSLELFDLKADPLEQANVAADYPALVLTLHLELDKLADREIKIGKPEKSLSEELKSLGYLK